MSNIAEILRKAEYFQEESDFEKEEDSIELYRMGRMCYCVKDYGGAEYWWEKAARQHDERAKNALIDLYNNELRFKDYRTPYIPSHSEAKGRIWPVYTGRQNSTFWVKNLFYR